MIFLMVQHKLNILNKHATFMNELHSMTVRLMEINPSGGWLGNDAFLEADGLQTLKKRLTSITGWSKFVDEGRKWSGCRTQTPKDAQRLPDIDLR